MATGTEAGLLDSPKPQSVYKHAILEQYVIRFATMTASKLTPKRAVLFDGYAGRGRFVTGEPGSAERMMIAAQKAKTSTKIDLFLVEKNRDDFASLDKVAGEYRGRGIHVDARNGDCTQYLADVGKLAAGASLFVFLDPCGAGLPMESIRGILLKRGDWPRTEVLLNFNADLIRRAGGQLKKGQLDLGGVAKADSVCGGGGGGGATSPCRPMKHREAPPGSRLRTRWPMNMPDDSPKAPSTAASSHRCGGRFTTSPSTT